MEVVLHGLAVLVIPFLHHFLMHHLVHLAMLCLVHVLKLPLRHRGNRVSVAGANLRSLAVLGLGSNCLVVLIAEHVFGIAAILVQVCDVVIPWVALVVKQLRLRVLVVQEEEALDVAEERELHGLLEEALLALAVSYLERIRRGNGLPVGCGPA